MVSLAVESKLAAAAPVRDDAACAGKVLLCGGALAGPAEGVGQHGIPVVPGGANVAVVPGRMLAAVLEDVITNYMTMGGNLIVHPKCRHLAPSKRASLNQEWCKMR